MEYDIPKKLRDQLNELLEGVEMKLYLLTYDNGEKYDDQENYTIGVFDNYEKACQLCRDKGYTENESVKGLFYKEKRFWGEETISIDEIELNKEIEY